MAPSDDQLIRQARGGDMQAFEQLVYRYDKNVFAIAARFVQSSDDAKDIYQEVFIRVFNALPKFEQRSEFSTWLYRITTNVCLTYRTQKKKQRQNFMTNDHHQEGDQDIDLTNARSSDASPHERAEASEVGTHIRNALRALSPKQKLVFTLRHYEGYKLKEIASMLQCTEGTVKRYLFSATQRMREQLAGLVEV